MPTSDIGKPSDEERITAPRSAADPRDAAQTPKAKDLR